MIVEAYCLASNILFKSHKLFLEIFHIGSSKNLAMKLI